MYICHSVCNSLGLLARKLRAGIVFGGVSLSLSISLTFDTESYFRIFLFAMHMCSFECLNIATSFSM